MKMRVLLFILVLVFTVSAQDRFAEATRLASKGDYTQALQSFRSAQMSSKDAEAAARIHYNIGVCLYQLDRSAEAVTELTAAIDLKGGQYQKAWYALGMAQARLEKTGEAKNAFVKATELNKKDAEAWFDLGLLQISDIDLAAARLSFENAVKFGSVYVADAHNNLGVIHALEGNVGAAIREFEISGSEEAKGNLKYCREKSATQANLVLSKTGFNK